MFETIDLIRESCKFDSVDNASTALYEQSLDIDQMKEIEPLKLNIESVRIFSEGENYYIEYSELLRFAESSNLSLVDSLNAISEFYNNDTSNDITFTQENFSVALENSNTFNFIIENAKNGNTIAKDILEEVVSNVKTLREAGVTIVMPKNTNTETSK